MIKWGGTACKESSEHIITKENLRMDKNQNHLHEISNIPFACLHCIGKTAEIENDNSPTGSKQAL